MRDSGHELDPVDRRNGSMWGLAFVIPTRNRPIILAHCLRALAGQSEKRFTVVVVASGSDVSDVINEFNETLELVYEFSLERGQIAQRNLGICRALEMGADYIGFLDDDIELSPSGFAYLSKKINLLREKGMTDFGLGFNLLEEQQQRSSFRKMIRRSLGFSDKPGAVSKVGINADFKNLRADIRTQWLGGGYTVWSRKILITFPNNKVTTSYAGGEDLRYSYPIGKIYPLLACAGVRAREIKSADEIDEYHRLFIRHKSDVVARLYFCDQHIEFNTMLSAVSMIIFSAIDLLFGGKKASIKFRACIAGTFWYARKRRKGSAVLEID